MSLIKKLSTVLLAASLFFAPCISQAATTNISLSKAQYIALQKTIDKQESILNALDLNLTALQSTSTMQKKELIAANKDLEKSKRELQTTKEKLNKAKISLKKADETLRKNEELLKKLSTEIKAEQHKRKVAKRQRDMYAVIALLTVGGAVIK